MTSFQTDQPPPAAGQQQPRASILIPSADGTLVLKKCIGPGAGQGQGPHHDPLTQMRIHELAYFLVHDQAPQDFPTLRIPKLASVPNDPRYWMERIDTRRPLWLSDDESITQCDINFIHNLRQELAILWKRMWAQGFALWDFELFLQDDHTVTLLDFSRVGLRQTNPMLPNPYMGLNVDPRLFFDHPCFPPNFDGLVEYPFRRLLD